NEATPLIDCRDGMAQCQRYELFTPGDEERIRLNSKRTRLRLGKGGESRIDLGLGIGLHDLKLHPLCLRCPLHVVDDALGLRIVWVYEQSEYLGLGTSSDSSSNRLGISSAVKKLTR